MKDGTPAGRVRAYAFLSDAPATRAWLALAVALHLLLKLSPPERRYRLLLAASTNLSNLRKRPLIALAVSPLVVKQTRSLLGFAATCATVFAPLERRAGRARWLAAFVAGHAGTSLVITGGLWLIHLCGGADQTAVEDVGTSYASRTLLAASVYLVRRPWRQACALVLLVGHVRGALLRRGFSDCGHLICIVMGLAIGPRVVDNHKLHRPQVSSERKTQGATL